VLSIAFVSGQKLVGLEIGGYHLFNYIVVELIKVREQSAFVAGT
jgi:hypothetical protein